MKKQTNTKPIEAYFTRNQVISRQVQEGWKVIKEEGLLSSSSTGQEQIHKTPKRRQFLESTMGESPAKKQKLSPIFLEKLSYWQKKEESNSNTHRGPDFSTVRDFSGSIHGPDQMAQSQSIVTQRDRPGGDERESEWINILRGVAHQDQLNT